MIPENTIKETATYLKASSFEQKFLLKRSNMEIINHTITVFKNTNYLNENIGGKNISIVKEILNLNK